MARGKQSHSLVLVAKNHPGEADARAEGRKQQHRDMRPLLQVRKAVLWDPGPVSGTPINRCEQKTTITAS